MSLTWLTAGLTGLVAFWGSIRASLDTMLSLVWCRVEVQDQAAYMLLSHLQAHYRRGRAGSSAYDCRMAYVRPNERREWVGLEVYGGLAFFWRGLAFVCVRGIRVADSSRMSGIIHVGHIRGFFNVETLLVKAIAEFNNSRANLSPRSNRYRVVRHHGLRHSAGMSANASTAPDHPEDAGITAENSVRILGWRPEDIGEPAPEAPFDGLFYSADVKSAVAHIHQWRRSKHHYKKWHIPWRMGALLHGPPGTGKTSFARAIAQELDFPVHTIDLTTMDNHDLGDAWRSAQGDAPCVVLIEDMDRVFCGSENLLKGSNLTMDALLNCISGIEDGNGMLTIVTANDPAALDPAMGIPSVNGTSSRPGRLDIAIEFGSMDQECMTGMTVAILGEESRENTEIYANESLQTPAQVQAACAEIALKRLYRGQA